MVVAERARHYGPISYFVLVATTSTLAILVTYILLALSGAVFFLRSRDNGRGALGLVLDVAVPALAIAVCSYTIYKSIVPRPPHPVHLAPYLAGGWLLAGVLVATLLNARDPARVRAFGSILAP